MSSDSNGRKPDSPGSGTAPSPSRAGVRVASAWGPPRDALAAVHNLEALLRSTAVSQKTILDLVPELRSSAEVLRRVVDTARDDKDVKGEVSAYGSVRVSELDALLDAAEAGRVDRHHLASRAGVLADELEAVIDLLALLDLAESPVSTDVGLDFIAREAGRTSGTARGREVVVRFDGADPDRPVSVDPYMLGALLALLVACVQSSGAESLVLRARAGDRPRFLVEPSTSADAALPSLSIRVMAHIAPSERAARRVAEQLGGALELADGRGSITLPSGSND
ncbi:MAG TPA: hypothetical protein VEK07_23190 [Polyangiaceae bacterium]|nr:hypothetical protein [Polyangiaceae bacterium]